MSKETKTIIRHESGSLINLRTLVYIKLHLPPSSLSTSNIASSSSNSLIELLCSSEALDFPLSLSCRLLLSLFEPETDLFSSKLILRSIELVKLPDEFALTFILLSFDFCVVSRSGI